MEGLGPEPSKLSSEANLDATKPITLRDVTEAGSSQCILVWLPQDPQAQGFSSICTWGGRYPESKGSVTVVQVSLT